jgi:hypothetical protein
VIDGSTVTIYTETDTNKSGQTFPVSFRTTTISGETVTISSQDPTFTMTADATTETVDYETVDEWTTDSFDSYDDSWETTTYRTTENSSGVTMTISSADPTFSTLTPTDTWTDSFSGETFTEWTSETDVSGHMTNLTFRTTTLSDGSVVSLDTAMPGFSDISATPSMISYEIETQSNPHFTDPAASESWSYESDNQSSTETLIGSI